MKARPMLAPALLAVFLATCSSEPTLEPASSPTTVPTPESTDAPAQTSAALPESSEATSSTTEGPTETTIVDAARALDVLPVRDGVRRETSGSVPHVQIDAVPVDPVDAELRRRAFLLPGVEDRPSAVSVAGARGLVISNDVEMVRGDVLLAAGEFAHIHPDGSLHVWLPVDRAREVDETNWGELHPWVERDNFWDGVAMVFTPESLDELDVTMRLLVDAYNFIVGAELTVADVS